MSNGALVGWRREGMTSWSSHCSIAAVVPSSVSVSFIRSMPLCLWRGSFIAWSLSRHRWICPLPPLLLPDPLKPRLVGATALCEWRHSRTRSFSSFPASHHITLARNLCS